MAKKTRKRFDTGGYMAHGGKVELIFHGSSREIPMGEFDSAADAKRYVESSDWQRPYSIRKINKTPKIVRTQFEEEVFEYADGGELVRYKILEKYKYGLGKIKHWKDEKLQTGGREFLTFKQAQDFKKKLQEMTSSFEYKVVKVDYADGGMMSKGGETKPSLIPDYKKISNVEVEDIDRDDYPDFSDAYISYAEYDGEPMTDEQLEELNQDGLFVYDAIHSRLFADGGEIRKFDPSYKFTYYEDDDLEKLKSDIIVDAKKHIKYVANYYGTIKADELNSLLTRIKNANNAEELAFLLDKISHWFYDNTDIQTEMGMSKMARGGKVKSRWIQDALSGDKGALRKTAKRKGLIKGDEKLSKSDLRKLEKMGGKTAKRARLAETLIDFKK